MLYTLAVKGIWSLLIVLLMLLLCETTTETIYSILAALLRGNTLVDLHVLAL